MRFDTPFVVETSVRVYRALLWLYPAEHREEYGGLMAQVFRDKANDVYLKDGDAGMIVYWFSSILDLLISVIQERKASRFGLSFYWLRRLRSQFMILGGAFIVFSAYSNLEPGFWWNGDKGLYGIASKFFLPGVIFFMLGLLGTFMALRRQIPHETTSNKLLIGIGLLPLLGASVISGIMFTVMVAKMDWDGLGWGLFMVLLSATFLSLIPLTIVLLRTGQRWSLLLIIHPIYILISWLNSLSHEYVDTPGPHWDQFFIVVTMGVIWMIAGYRLRQNTTHTLFHDYQQQPTLQEI